MKWITVREKEGLSNHSFGRRVTAKIRQLAKFEDALQQLQKKFKNADQDETEEIKGEIETLEAAIKKLNRELCGDMRRTSSNLKRENSSSGNTSTSTPVASGAPKAQTAGSAGASPGQAAAGTTQTQPASSTGKQSQTTTTSTATANPNVGKTKKKNRIGLVVVLSLLTGGFGFLLGYNSK